MSTATTDAEGALAATLEKKFGSSPPSTPPTLSDVFASVDVGKVTSVAIYDNTNPSLNAGEFLVNFEDGSSAGFFFYQCVGTPGCGPNPVGNIAFTAGPPSPSNPGNSACSGSWTYQYHLRLNIPCQYQVCNTCQQAGCVNGFMDILNMTYCPACLYCMYSSTTPPPIPKIGEMPLSGAVLWDDSGAATQTYGSTPTLPVP